jgi:hypothetical protein
VNFVAKVDSKDFESSQGLTQVARYLRRENERSGRRLTHNSAIQDNTGKFLMASLKQGVLQPINMFITILLFTCMEEFTVDMKTRPQDHDFGMKVNEAKTEMCVLQRIDTSLFSFTLNQIAYTSVILNIFTKKF